MGDDPGAKIHNGFAGATSVNTSIPWWSQHDAKLDGTLDTKIDGMTGYAKNQGTIAKNMMGEQSKLGVLGELPPQALGGGGFGEGSYAAQLLAINAREFATYFGNLGQAIMNTGMAAQTVADAYGSSDSMSAIKMNSIDFAYAVPGAHRPAGVPPQLGKTWAQQNAEQAGKSNGQPADPNSASWHQTGTNPVTGAATYTSSDGSMMSVWTGTNPATGQQETVTTVIGANGTQVTTTKAQTGPGRYTTTTTSQPSNGKATTTKSTTTTTTQDGETTVTTRGQDGSENVHITSKDGTETQATFDKNGNETSVAGHGPQAGSPGVQNPNDDPLKKRMDQIPGQTVVTLM